MPDGRPNILVTWGDDVGISNLSCYSDGMVGYRTPNINRTASEGMRFTDPYSEQGCTTGCAAFLDTFKEFPPRYPPASFSIDQIVKKLEEFLAAD